MSRRFARALGALALTASLAVESRALVATDFLRGDANDDGLVTLADAHFVTLYLFLGKPPSPCLKAMDSNSDGRIGIADGIWTINQLLRNGPAFPAPYPTPGPEPEEVATTLPCASWGNSSQLSDPTATLRVVAATAAGGGDASVRIRLAVESAIDLAGYRARIRVPGGVIVYVDPDPADLSGTFDVGVESAHFEGGAIDAGFLTSIVRPAPLVASEEEEVLEIGACLAPGLAAGEYPLELEIGELVEFSSGRSISPALASGVLLVEADVSPGADCDASSGGSPGDPDPGEVPDPDVMFKLPDITVANTDPIVPLVVESNAGVQGFSFSIDFDEEVLQVSEIEEVFVIDRDEGFKVYEFNNENASPGNGGVDEGFIIGAGVVSFERPIVLPVDAENEVLRFHFDVVATEPEVSTELVFRDGGQGSEQPVKNGATVRGKLFEPTTTPSFVLIHGTLHVLPDVTIFIRGDANGDSGLDLSDAQTTLGFLFLGAEQPFCLDAADANDDGLLNIADPVGVLNFLFLGGSPPPAPFPGPGEDPTPDRMGCLFLAP